MSQIFGGGGGTTITLETNGVANAIQTLLNLIAGGNITLVSNGLGGVTISASVSNIPAIIQSNQNSSGSAAFLSTAFTSSNNGGNAILVIAQWKSSSVTMAVAATNLNGYNVLRGPDTNGTKPLRQQSWLATGITGGSNT